MRITDEAPDEPAKNDSPSQIMNKIKTVSTVSSITEPDTKKIVADVQSTKLRSLLNQLNK
jgi:hypothetical protein